MKPGAIISPFARRLRQLARKSGPNQTTAAKALGLTEPTLSRFLTGERQAGTATALKISRRTGCDLLWLLTGKRSSPTPRCIKRLNQIMARPAKPKTA